MNNDNDFTEDSELVDSVRRAFDVGEVPEHLRRAVHDAAVRNAVFGRRFAFSRMSRWVSGLTTTAAAAIICMYSANQTFGRAAIGHDELQRLDRIMDLVSPDYDDEIADGEGARFAPPSGKLTLDYVAERYDRMQTYETDDEDYYL